MPLILCTIPRCVNQLQVAKIRFEDIYHLRRLPIEDYITMDEAKRVFPKKDFFKRLVDTHSFFGFQLTGAEEVYIYPSHFYDWLKRYYKKKIKETISDSQATQYLH